MERAANVQPWGLQSTAARLLMGKLDHAFDMREFDSTQVPKGLLCGEPQ